MNIIFNGGEKLYFKQHPAEFLEKCLGTKLPIYQKQMLNQANDNPKIYGDDFLIEIVPQNVEGKLVLSIKDFDESQNKESEINISFNEQELGQLIKQLELYYEVWE